MIGVGRRELPGAAVRDATFVLVPLGRWWGVNSALPFEGSAQLGQRIYPFPPTPGGEVSDEPLRKPRILHRRRPDCYERGTRNYVLHDVGRFRDPTDTNHRELYGSRDFVGREDSPRQQARPADTAGAEAERRLPRVDVDHQTGESIHHGNA